MMDFKIEQLIPLFLLSDGNGYAMAKAIEQGLSTFCETIQTGIDTILDVESMPEWRLDEMAWELNCLYDFAANVENKRAWIREAERFFSRYGTKMAIVEYLRGRFSFVNLEENWQYGGEPYHFRIGVDNGTTEENIRWAQNAVEQIKNVRSVLDTIRLNISARIGVQADTEAYSFWVPAAGGNLLAGMYPGDNDPI